MEILVLSDYRISLPRFCAKIDPFQTSLGGVSAQLLSVHNFYPIQGTRIRRPSSSTPATACTYLGTSDQHEEQENTFSTLHVR